MGIKPVNLDNISADSVRQAAEKSLSNQTFTQKIINNISD